jgi:FkbM family methyltransferase
MISFSESLRYDYPLTADSMVVEVGCNTGNWAEAMSIVWSCRILTYEPIKQFYDVAVARFAANGLNRQIRVENAAVGARDGMGVFHVRGDLSGFYTEGESEEVMIVSVAQMLANPWIVSAKIDVMALNCEGGEYDILEDLLETGEIARMENLQVQWHSVVEDFSVRRAVLRHKLAETHHPACELGNFDTGWDLWAKLK